MKFSFTADGHQIYNNPVLPVKPDRSTPLTLFAQGSFGGGTLKVMASPSGDFADAVDVTGVTLNSAGYKALPLMQAVFFLVLSGSTSPTITAWLQ